MKIEKHNNNQLVILIARSDFHLGVISWYGVDARGEVESRH
jgi:hypothetical protein